MREPIPQVSWCFAVILLLIAAAFAAQDGISETYDISQSIKLTGLVSKLEWTSPHVFITLLVKTQGRSDTWSLEAGAPDELAVAGWTRDDLKIGTAIKVTAYPARGFRPTDAPRKAYATKIEPADLPTVLIGDQITRN